MKSNLFSRKTCIISMQQFVCITISFNKSTCNNKQFSRILSYNTEKVKCKYSKLGFDSKCVWRRDTRISEISQDFPRICGILGKWNIIFSKKYLIVLSSTFSLKSMLYYLLRTKVKKLFSHLPLDEKHSKKCYVHHGFRSLVIIVLSPQISLNSPLPTSPGDCAQSLTYSRQALHH